MKKILTLLFIGIFFFSYGQEKTDQVQYNKSGIISFLKFNEEKHKVPLSEVEKLLKDSLKISNANELILKKEEEDQFGYVHQHYKQYYKGIAVEYGGYAVHAKNGKIEYIAGNYKNIVSVNVTPVLSEEEAFHKALAIIKAKKYKWDNPDEEKLLKEITNNEEATYYPQGSLIIIKDVLQSDREYRLAYKFNIYAEMPLSRKFYYIDAINGSLLDMEEIIKHANAPGSGATRYSGMQSFVTDSYSGEFRLQEIRNGVVIRTMNMKKGTNYGAASEFLDNDNNWSAGEYNNSDLDNAALDAHWGAEKVFDYFHNVHGRNSWDGSGGAILNYVHANLIAMGYPNNDNAFWDGQRMTYGDGGTMFSPLTSLDVVAHEMGHGVMDKEADLAYEKESGALNEGFSDIWAACVEARFAPGKQRWSIGEDISLLGFPLRSMSNPKSGGLSSQPTTYGGTYWVGTNNCTPNSSNDNCGVHTNSGVLNYWFYILTNGKSGINDLNNAYNVQGIGMDDAEMIAYRALSVHLTNQEATFIDARNATILAATDLFGNGSCEVKSTIDAWYAVGVGNPYQSNMNISGASTLCHLGSSYYISNVPIGATITWSSSPNITLLSSQGSNPATFKATSTESGPNSFIKASINTACGSVNTTKNYIATTPGFATNPVIQGSSVVCNGGYWSVQWPSGADDIMWDFDQNNMILLSGGLNTQSITLQFKPGATGGWVSVKSHNACGWTPSPNYLGIAKMCNYYSYTISPNPSSSRITINKASVSADKVLESNELKTTNIPSVFAEIYSLKDNKLLKSFALEEEETLIDIQNIGKGVYVLRILENDAVIMTERLIFD